jgi:hypothetical protein
LRPLPCTFPVLSKLSAGELLEHQAGEQQQRAAWPVVHYDVLDHPVGVAANNDDNAAGLAVDRSGVVLQEAIAAAGTEVVEVLVLLQRFGGEHN